MPSQASLEDNIKNSYKDLRFFIYIIIFHKKSKNVNRKSKKNYDKNSHIVYKNIHKNFKKY